MSDVSYRIKRYMFGILFLALSGFILSAVATLVNTIPETNVNVGNAITRTYTTTTVEYTTGYQLLVHATYNQFASFCSGYCYTRFEINLNEEPPPDYRYLIVLPIPENFVELDVSGLGVGVQYLTSNGTHYFLLYDFSIGYIRVITGCCNIWSQGWIRVYLVDYDLQLPPPPESLAGGEVTRTLTYTTTEYPASISNKTVLALISFVAGIFIVLKALSYFDINI
jgi:hypothetical protein